MSLRTLTIIALSALSPAATLACSCDWGESISLVGYDSVFRGRVVSRSSLVRTEEDVVGPLTSFAVMLVSEVWKGAEVPIVTVFGGIGADCGYVFEDGEEYFVFAKRIRAKGGLIPRGALHVSTCSPTGSTQTSGSVRRELEKRRSRVMRWRVLRDDGTLGDFP